MRTSKGSKIAEAERRKAAQLARLQARFAVASGEEVAYELAQRMLSACGQGAVPFLLAQANSGGVLGEAAIAALHAAPEETGKAIVRALETEPNSQPLARALPPVLPLVLARRLVALLPEVSDPPALRYLAQRLAGASPQLFAPLRQLQLQTVDPLLVLAIRVGLAAAGDAAACEGLVAQLPHAANPELRLMLSSRTLAESEVGLSALRGLLVSQQAGDRAYALDAIEGLALAPLAKEVAEAFVREDSEAAAYAALKALPVALQYLTQPQLQTLLDAACDVSGLEALQDGTTRVLTAEARAWATRLDRAWVLCAYSAAGNPSLFTPIAEAAVAAVGVLATRLVADPVEPRVLVACSAIVRIQMRCVAPLWDVDRTLAWVLQSKLGGTVLEPMLRATGPAANHSSVAELLQELPEESHTAAQVIAGILTLEEGRRRIEHVYATLTRSVLRRLRLLRRIGYHPDSATEVGIALGASQERERAAVLAAEADLGADVVSGWQSRYDERTLVLEMPVGLMGDFLKRRGRGLVAEAPAEGLVALLAEQVLQSDLCALLGAMPKGHCAWAQLVRLLESRSALVRAGAEAALARHPETTGDLRHRLRQEAAPTVQARLLEILRCLGCPRSLGFARQALAADNELLQAAAVRYVGQFGRLADLLPHASTFHAGSEFVRLAAIQSLDSLTVGSPAQKVQLLADFLGNASPAESGLAAQLLQAQPPETVNAAVEQRMVSDDALVRVRGEKLLKGAVKGAGGPRSLAQGAVVAMVAGEGVLGHSLMLTGEAPWQWGLPGLTVAETPREDAYLDLLRQDDELARRWDEWRLTGQSPLDLLPSLQRMAAGTGAKAEAATAMGLDIIGVGAGLYVEAFASYHNLPLDEPLGLRVEAVLDTVFKQCTPAVAHNLRTPNASHNTMFSEILGTSLRGEMAGHIFCLAYAELLKESLSAEFFGPTAKVVADDDVAFREQVEREWDQLKVHEDWYYGFWVWPRLALADLGRYCSDRKADNKCRQEMASYLAYLATSLPIFPERVREARKALVTAFDSRLREGAHRLRLVLQRRAKTEEHSDWAAIEVELHRRLVRLFGQAIRTFDVHWLAPRPVFPLGTLRMAWEPRRTVQRDGALFPEHHLSFANLIEKRIADLVREERSERGDGLVVASLDAPFDDEEEAPEPGHRREDDWERRDRVVDQIAEGQETIDIVSAMLEPQPPTLLGTHARDVTVKDQVLKCWDIRQAAELLGCHADTLRRYDRDGKIRFVWDDGYRYLPVEELERATIVLRKTSKWAEMLGVSDQTVRNWMKEIPHGIDPLEMERLLLERERDSRGRKGGRKGGRKPAA